MRFGRLDVRPGRRGARARRDSQSLPLAWLIVALLVSLGAPWCAADEPGAKKLDVPYEPTHPRVVEAMLRLANVGKDDVHYDLGCGDGRIVIMAAEKFGARGVGADIDAQRIKESKENAKAAGVSDRVEFKQQDIFKLDLSPATVVTLYLLNPINLQLRPKLFAELKPGTRIVSHAFHMEDWEADQLLRHPRARNKLVYFWVVPAGVGGVWTWAEADGSACKLDLQQEFQVVRGRLAIKDREPLAIADAQVNGTQFQFTVTVPGDPQPTKIVYEGRVDGDTIRGTCDRQGGAKPGKSKWEAKREPVNIDGRWQVTLEPSMATLNGQLHIGREDGRRVVQYVRTSSNVEIDVPRFYAWGTSVRFEIPADRQLWIFKGSLRGESGAGTVIWETSTKEPAWAAKRLKASD